MGAWADRMAAVNEHFGSDLAPRRSLRRRRTASIAPASSVRKSEAHTAARVPVDMQLCEAVAVNVLASFAVHPDQVCPVLDCAALPAFETFNKLDSHLRQPLDQLLSFASSPHLTRAAGVLSEV